MTCSAGTEHNIIILRLVQEGAFLEMPEENTTTDKCEHCETVYIVGGEDGLKANHCCGRCKRCREVLRRLKSCEQYRAAIRSLLAPIPDDNHIRDWCISVQWALRKCGMGGASALIGRLTPPCRSQANSWLSVALLAGMTTEEARLIYKIAVAFFLGELDRRGIPDDYRDWKAVA